MSMALRAVAPLIFSENINVLRCTLANELRYDFLANLSAAFSGPQLLTFYTVFFRCKIAGKTVNEGRTVKVQMQKPATEVVFIVEAKQCNANATHRRSLGLLVRSLHKTLRDEGFGSTK